jgi:hypothetical protein
MRWQSRKAARRRPVPRSASYAKQRGGLAGAFLFEPMLVFAESRTVWHWERICH